MLEGLMQDQESEGQWKMELNQKKKGGSIDGPALFTSMFCDRL
jgi:hypothetical protein